MEHFTWRNIAIFTLHWITIVSKVTSAAGIFDLRLNSFINDQAVDLNGQCCGNTTLGSTNQCVGPCRTFFSLCLLHYLRQIPEEPLPGQCTFDHRSTSILGENTFNVHNTDGLIRIPFDIDWPGDFSLALDAWHNDTSAGPLGADRRLLARLRVHRSLNATSQWSNFTYTTDSTSGAGHALSYSYRVVCAKNYFGSKCSKQCTPRNDSYGHYRCNSEGERVCLDGWDGNWCEEAQCVEGCVHGSCVAPNVCSCESGYRGATCDECATYAGCDHGTCVTPGECICKPGWGGLLCDTDLNYCTNHQPCLNNATCRNEGPLGFRCYCPPSFTGTHCEVAEACPCLNGGTCRTGPDGYTCLCPAGFTGEFCDRRVPRCDADKCLNGGTCIDGTVSYRCSCATGFSGTHCEVVDHCASSPCVNGGTCINNNVNFQCRCPDGFRGARCEENICANHACENGGTCRAESDSVHCDCPLGFNGDHCQHNIDDCLASPCKNGATCVDLVNEYYCQCAFGFGGRNCSDHFVICTGDNPCENGGTCLQDVMGGFRCECLDDWRGTTCTVSMTGLETPTEPSTELKQGGHMESQQPNLTFGLSDTTQLVIYVSFGFLVIALVIILIIVVYRKQHHPDHRPNDLEANTTPNNRNKLTYKDNFSQEEKVLPLLSISGKVCNKEKDTYSKANSQNMSSNALQHEKNTKYSIKEEGLPSLDKQIIPTTGSVNYVPQARHSYPRYDSGEYYYDEKSVPLKRTDSSQTQTPSQSSSSQSTPMHTGNTSISQISAVVEDRGTPPVTRLHATEV